MRNTLSRISLGLLTLALFGLVSSRVLAQPVQPKQKPPAPLAPPSDPGCPPSDLHCSNGKHIKDAVLTAPKPAPTPNPKMGR